MNEIFISHEITAFDSDGYIVAQAEAEDRQSAEVAGQTLILDDDTAATAEIRRTRDGQLVAWHTRDTDIGVRRISIFKD